MAGLHLVTPAEYRRALLQGIPNATRRVVIAAMIVLWGGQTEAIFDEIQKALQRGVQVTILLDIFTAATLLNHMPHARQYWEKTNALLHELYSAGATIYRVGSMGMNPYRKRCHVKITVIDNDAYSFGGINFFNEQFQNNDYMLLVRSQQYADCLVELVDRIGRSKGRLPNAAVHIDTAHTILFDGGQPDDSIIYQKACELAAQATRAYYVSQCAVSGPLAKLLGDINTTYYTNRPEHMHLPSSWAQAFDLQRYHTTNSYSRSQYIHAKYILFELPGGRRALLSGSNNFSYRGIAYGTKEIALYSTDRDLWQQLLDYLEHTIVRGHGRPPKQT